jgi:hypothetical protein
MLEYRTNWGLLFKKIRDDVSMQKRKGAENENDWKMFYLKNKIDRLLSEELNGKKEFQYFKFFCLLCETFQV